MFRSVITAWLGTAAVGIAAAWHFAGDAVAGRDWLMIGVLMFIWSDLSESTQRDSK